MALCLVHIFIPLMLQKPSLHSRAKENNKYIDKRLAYWSEGRLGDILSECQIIQKRMKKERQNHDRESKSFRHLYVYRTHTNSWWSVTSQNNHI